MNKLHLLTLLAPPLLLAACSGGDKAQDKAEPAIPVEVSVVQAGRIDAAYRGTATLEALDEAVVMAKQAGVIEQVLVEEGDRVRAAQVLARLETDKLRLQVSRARADVQRLSEDFARLKSVFQRNLVSREAYDKTQYELEAARAELDLAELALREAEVKAPFDGVVTARYVRRGNLIQPNAQAFRVTQLEHLRAHIYVPERDIHKLKPQHPVKLSVDAWPARFFDGVVTLVNPVVDATTGTVKVTVTMAPKQPELRPGMFARAEILYDRREQALLIPRDAVIVEDAAESVYVVAEGKARRRPIRTGYGDSEHYEVLQGLKAGEQVVVTGQASLKDDARVQIVKPLTMPASVAEQSTGSAG